MKRRSFIISSTLVGCTFALGFPNIAKATKSPKASKSIEKSNFVIKGNHSSGGCAVPQRFRNHHHNSPLYHYEE